MNEQPKDGGPAFPVVESEPAYNHDWQRDYTRTFSAGGMSLRDYFAGQALAGLSPGQFCDEFGKVLGADDDARRAYELADAMLAERERTTHGR